MIHRILLGVLAATLAMSQIPHPVPPVWPSWVVPYPGASARTRQSSALIESTYTTPAPPHDVLSHYRQLFAAAGVRFDPAAAGGFIIRAPLPECDLSINIRPRDSDTEVRVTCAAKFASTDRIRAQHEATEAERRLNDPMKKYDTPVYPKPDTTPPLRWPPWLVRVDGAKLPVEKFPGQMRSHFVSQPSRDAIQAFYANLLAAHGYRVVQRLAAVPEKFGSWVEATADPDNDQRRKVVICVQIRPAGQNFSVELSVQ